MDEERQFTDSEREALNAVAKALQENAEREAQAIVGYTEQIRVIEDGIAKVKPGMCLSSEVRMSMAVP